MPVLSSLCNHVQIVVTTMVYKIGDGLLQNQSGLVLKTDRFLIKIEARYCSYTV
jgi:hypothetical protein